MTGTESGYDIFSITIVPLIGSNNPWPSIIFRPWNARILRTCSFARDPSNGGGKKKSIDALKHSNKLPVILPAYLCRIHRRIPPIRIPVVFAGNGGILFPRSRKVFALFSYIGGDPLRSHFETKPSSSQITAVGCWRAGLIHDRNHSIIREDRKLVIQ